MQVSYKVRPSQSPWPRVMRCVGRLTYRSVHRGKTRPCIGFELTPLVITQAHPSPQAPHPSRRTQKQANLSSIAR
jgi:hypothetical protein